MSTSFIIPVWEKTTSNDILRTLNSLKPFVNQIDEIVIIFDGYESFFLEINASKNILNKLTYIYLGNNKGPGLARNMGVYFARNKIIFILDAGDECLPNRLDVQLINVKKFGVAYGAIKYLNDSGYYVSRNLNINKAKLLLPFQNPYPNCCLAIKKEIFLKIGGYPPLRTAEDWVLAGKIINYFKYIPYSSQPVIKCIISNKSKNLISRRHGLKILKRIIMAHLLMVKMNLYNIIFFPLAIFYQLCLRLFPYKLFNLLYKLRLIIFFKNDKFL